MFEGMWRFTGVHRIGTGFGIIMASSHRTSTLDSSRMNPGYRTIFTAANDDDMVMDQLDETIAEELISVGIGNKEVYNKWNVLGPSPNLQTAKASGSADSDPSASTKQAQPNSKVPMPPSVQKKTSKSRLSVPLAPINQHSANPVNPPQITARAARRPSTLAESHATFNDHLNVKHTFSALRCGRCVDHTGQLGHHYPGFVADSASNIAE